MTRTAVLPVLSPPDDRVRVPLITYVATCSLAVPVLVTWLRGEWRGPRGWVAAWAGLLFAESGLQFVLSKFGIHNLWVGYVFTPLSAALVLWALSLWQLRRLARRTVRLAIPAALVAFAVLTFAFDNTSTFSRAAQPMMYLVCLGASAYTLVARSLAGTGDLLRQGWFWICAGVTLYSGTFGSLSPLSELLLPDPTLFTRAYELAMALMLVAFLVIARGIALPET
jgi:hypothetical protein